MDYTTWVLIAGTTALCTGVFWIGQTLNSLQKVNIAKGLKDQSQDQAIATLIKREDINRSLLQTIVTKLSILEERVR